MNNSTAGLFNKTRSAGQVARRMMHLLNHLAATPARDLEQVLSVSFYNDRSEKRGWIASAWRRHHNLLK
jgi:hypothetical protein